MTGVGSVVVLLSILAQGIVGQNGPCTNATQLHSLHLRIADYQLKKGEQPVGDYYIPEQWYSLGGYIIAKTNVSCGTAFGWHIEGDLPEDNRKKQLDVCNSDCSLKKNIDVIRCDNGTFVFKLQPLDSNADAYCIEPYDAGNQTPKPDLAVPDIEFKPTISTKVIYQTKKNNLHFYCDFVPKDKTLYFTVEWKLTSGFKELKLLHKTKGIKYDDQFKTGTALNEDHLSSKGISKLPFTIMCSVTAQKDIAGPYSNFVSSEPKFCGIKILTSRNVRIEDDKEENITMQLTVPFGCPDTYYDLDRPCPLQIDLLIPSPPEDSTCELPQLRTIETKRMDCGVTISSENYDSPKHFTIRAKFGDIFARTNPRYSVMFRTNPNRAHPLFNGYVFEGATVVVSAKNRNQINGRLCYSHNDPHMRTFEGRNYENQTPGTYVLYKHDVYPIEVQVKSSQISSRVSLNCGIAIRAGKDLFVYSHCDSKAAVEVNFRLCDDGVLNKKVRQSGRKYMVYLPTGTTVQISMGHSRYVNFEVIPSEEDIGKTSGLCGKIGGTIETPVPSQYRVHANGQSDLFNISNYQYLESWTNGSDFMCQCDWDFGKDKYQSSYGNCTAEYKSICSVGQVSKLDHVCEKARKKRWVRGSNGAEEEHFWISGDIHASRQTSYTMIGSHDHRQEREVSKRQIQVYDEITARADCLAILNTTTFQRCSNLPHLDLTSIMKDCITDAMITGTMEWALTHLESIKDACIHHVRVNQPLSKEAKTALAKLENITREIHANFSDAVQTNTTHTDGSNYMSTGTTHTVISTTMPSVVTTSSPANEQQLTFSEDLLQEITENSCPNECSFNGKCTKGECVCNDGYTDIDCSISADQPPIMNGIPDLGLCDKAQRPCRQTSVFGEQIVESSKLSCKLTPFTVHRNSNLTYEESTIVPAEVISIFEVKCPLPLERRKREVSGHVSDDNIASGYKISLSNTGNTYSDDDSIVVFDSRCVDCSKNGGNIVCKQKPDFCIRSGECYRFGDIKECDMCGGDDVNSVTWIPNMDCHGLPDNRYDNPIKPWIIAAVVVPFAVVVFVATLVICCKSGKKGKGSNADSNRNFHSP